ncbi:hypothetical protein GQ600_12436 [Phytophthora cactorum]|nr:hypothetical protein GQ600_12436 [Phytophthora cactorum]
MIDIPVERSHLVETIKFDIRVTLQPSSHDGATFRIAACCQRLGRRLPGVLSEMKSTKHC